MLPNVSLYRVFAYLRINRLVLLPEVVSPFTIKATIVEAGTDVIDLSIFAAMEAETRRKNMLLFNAFLCRIEKDIEGKEKSEYCCLCMLSK